MARRHARDATSTRAALSGAHIARGENSPSGTVPRIRSGLARGGFARVHRVHRRNVKFAARSSSLFPAKGKQPGLFRAKPPRDLKTRLFAAMRESARNLAPSSSTPGGRAAGGGDGCSAFYGEIWIFACVRERAPLFTSNNRERAALAGAARLAAIVDLTVECDFSWRNCLGDG